jgi:hypothetical protein
MTTQDWILRVGDGENLINSSRHKIWGIQTKTGCNKHFINNVKEDDRLWFVQSGTGGRIIAVASYVRHQKRQVGELCNVSMTNEELGWTGDDWTSDTEVHYKNLYGVKECELLTGIIGSASIRKYNDKCKLNLPMEYNNITRYCKALIDRL